MPKFSTAFYGSFEPVEAAIHFKTKLTRQEREGAHNHGNRELARTANNVGSALGYLADSLVILGGQTQTLAWEQTGDVTKAKLDSIADQLRLLALQLPPVPQ